MPPAPPAPNWRITRMDHVREAECLCSMLVAQRSQQFIVMGMAGVVELLV